MRFCALSKLRSFVNNVVVYEGSQEEKIPKEKKSSHFDQRSAGNIDPIQVTKSVNGASYSWILSLRGRGINQVMR